MRLPDFLVIGAMKSGTTTFYHDLAGHPHVYLADKELGALTRDISAPQYAAHFKHARINQLCGDVSTGYSMLPDVTGVVERAARQLSPRAKILYLVREPVQRAISHHYHYISLRPDDRMEPDIDACVRKYSSLTDYGRYGEQLEHWTRQS
jgi:Sulfotransferase domain